MSKQYKFNPFSRKLDIVVDTDADYSGISVGLPDDAEFEDLVIKGKARYVNGDVVRDSEQYLATKKYVNNRDNPTVYSGGIVQLDSDATFNWGHAILEYNGYVYVATSHNDGRKMRLLKVDIDGTLTYIQDLASSIGTGNIGSLYTDGQFIYMAGRINPSTNGLHSFSAASDGTLTLIDSLEIGTTSSFGKLWGDGKFIYVPNGTDGVFSVSVDNSGNLTQIDQLNTSFAYNVCSDGNIYYMGNNGNGRELRTFTVDDDGNMTTLAQNELYQRSFTSTYCDGKFLYATTGHTTPAFRVYSLADDNGLITLLDSVIINVAETNQIYSDGKYIYVNNGSALKYVDAYEVDNSGQITLVNSTNLGYYTGCLYGHNNIIYPLPSSDDANGVYTYKSQKAYEYEKTTKRHNFTNSNTLKLPALTADSSNPENGDVYYNSTTHKLRLRANDSWVDLN